MRIGVLASLIANLFRKKGIRPLRPDEFILKFGAAGRPDWKDMLSKVEQLNSLFGGEDKRGKGWLGEPSGT